LIAVNEPTRCALWKRPEQVAGGPLKTHFELLETFVKESHWWRYLLRCRECGQRYFFEFYEEIDWVGGDDPQFSTWIPVSTEDEIEAARAAPAGALGGFVPRLCKDWPRDAEEPKVFWIKSAP
jgi:hypothetical protein